MYNDYCVLKRILPSNVTECLLLILCICFIQNFSGRYCCKIFQVLALRVFLWVLWFSSLYKTNISKLQFDQDRRPTQKTTMADVDYSQTIVLYLFIYN